MNVLLPATRHPVLTVLRWMLTVLLSLLSVALIWQTLVRLQPSSDRPQIGPGCTGPDVESTVEAVQTAVAAWNLTHGEPPESLTSLVDSNWMPASLMQPSGCLAPVVFEVTDEGWSVRAPVR